MARARAYYDEQDRRIGQAFVQQVAAAAKSLKTIPADGGFVDALGSYRAVPPQLHNS
jgi:hypothetical protein